MYINLYTLYYTLKQNTHSFYGGFILYTHLEDAIYKLYTSIDVRSPADLDMHLIAKKIGVIITYEKNKFFRWNNEIHLKVGSKVNEWMAFGHEIGHYCLHVGIQLIMHPLFRQLQEYQADHFAYHFCVPTFMLENLEEVNIDVIMNLFNVDYDFALRRIEMYQSKIIERMLVYEGSCR